MRRKQQPRKRNTPRLTDGLPFTKAERDIYAFCDRGPQCTCNGTANGCRREDPKALLFDLWERGGPTLDADLNMLQVPVPGSETATDTLPIIKRLVELTRAVFGVQAFDGKTGHGLTFDETVRLFFDLLAFVQVTQKKTPSLPTSPARTLVSSSPPATLDTKPSSDSGSTADDHSLDPPPVVPQESVLPSE